MFFLFDIGRVLLDFDFEPSLSRLLPPHTKNASEYIGHILSQKDALESGLISPEQFTNRALKILDNNITASQFQQAWREVFTTNHAMWQCVQQLADDGHHLILISNISAIHWPWICENYPHFDKFQGAVLSFETGFLKPEPEIFQQAIETYNLNPTTTAYIDDMPQNIAAGRQFGFQCWQYDLNNHQAFEHWLENILRKRVVKD